MKLLDKLLSPKVIRTNILPLGILGLTILTTGIGFITSRYGWSIYLELLSHFQVQYLLIVLFLCLILFFTRRRYYLIVSLFCCGVLLSQVLPWYLPPSLLFPKASGNFRILIANLNTQNRSYSKVISLVKKEKPDFAVFMEVDETWRDQLKAIKDLLPYSFGQANPYNLGLLIYANQNLINPQVKFFGTQNNASVITQLNLNTQLITVLATHPLPPLKSSFFNSRNQQLNLISEYLKSIKTPIIMVGDLNLTMWSPYYRRLITRTGLKNARKGFGVVSTWPTKKTYTKIPSWASLLLSIPIDHCLLSPGIDVIDLRAGADTGSDHRPLIVDLEINK